MLGLGVGLFAASLGIGVPIFAAMVIGSLFIAHFTYDIDLTVVANQMVSMINSHVLIAIGLFIIVGYLMKATKAADYLIDMVDAFIRQFPGGLCLVAVVASAAFGALCGSILAAIVAIGAVMLPRMEKEGYPLAFSTSLIAVSGILSILIPPSNLLIIYAACTEFPTGYLFAAGMVPGIVLTVLLYLGAIAMPAGRRRLPAATWEERRRALLKGLPVLGLPPLILGTIYAGVFTANEAAAAACFYIILIDLIFYHNLTPRLLAATIRDSALATAAIYILIAGTGAIVTIFHYTGVPRIIAEWALAGGTLFTFMLISLASGLVLGMMMDAIPTMLVLISLLLTAAEAFEMNLTQWGVFVTLVGAIGVCTPPMCSGLYVAAKVAKLPPTQLIAPIYYFLVPCIICSLMIAFMPNLSLWLPRLIYGW